MAAVRPNAKRVFPRLNSNGVKVRPLALPLTETFESAQSGSATMIVFTP